MAQLRNAANLYQQNSVTTALPAKLTLMLYDGAVKFCNIAREGFEEKNYAKSNVNIQKAENIITELRVTLDMKYPVAKEFDAVYDYIYRRLVEANIHRDMEALDEAAKHIKTMRETWKEVMRMNHVS